MMDIYPQDILGITLSDLLKSPFITDLETAPIVSELDDEWTVEVPPAGVSFTVGSSGKVYAVQLYACGKDGYANYVGALPSGIRLSFDRAETRGALGRPTQSGSEGEVALLGPVAAWDRFAKEGHEVHVSYGGPSGAIDLVTVSRPANRGDDVSSNTNTEGSEPQKSDEP